MKFQNKFVTGSFFKNNSSALLWVGAGALFLALLFARAIFPEYTWLTILVSILLVVDLAALIHQNRQALKSRTAAYGLNSLITIVLVIGLVGVINFLMAKHPWKADLTKNKVHSLSDQTVKVIKGLQKPVKAVYFAKVAQREEMRTLLDNLKDLNSKFEVEYVDPDKEPSRTRQVGIKKYGTLQLVVGNRDSKIEEVNEEKITNNLIKLLKERTQTFCALTGHGEKSFNAADAEGFDAAKKALANQSYEVREVSLLEGNKVPEDCNVIAIWGPTKAFFEPEVKAIREYLANGGRALVALDLNIKGGENAPELLPVLQDWYVKPVSALVVDPLSRMLGVDAAVPILASYSKENPITKDFQINCYFPFTRPLDILPGAPAGMNVQWLAQTTPKSWAESDLKELATGKVEMNPGKDKTGPITTVVAVQGKQKDSKANRNTRIVAFGTSFFANNNYARYGGNLDFFVNATSWLMEDENFISIRAKEDEAGKVELSQKQGTFIFLLTVLLIPGLIAVGGIVVWAIRRKM